MDFLTYLLTAFISLMGVVVGVMLANSAPEEVHQIKKYFTLIQLFAIVLLFFVLFSFFPFVIVCALLILTFGFFKLFWHKQDINFLDYVVFGSVFPLTSLVVVAHFYITIILFIFGVFSGALFYVLHTHPKKKKHQIKKVSHHAHKGRHHTYDELLSKLSSSYLFFLVLTIASYVIARLFNYFI